MRKLLLALTAFLLASCLSESNVDPGSSATFVRYYNGGNNDEAKALTVSQDGGYIILATTRIQKQETDIPVEKVKVIKTDAAGNPVWQKLYPDVLDLTQSFHAGGIQPITGGYAIIADEGFGDSTQVAVMTIDEDGELTGSGNPTTERYLQAKAITVNAAGNYLVLFVKGGDEMYVAELDKNTFLPVTPAPLLYEAGQTQLANRLLLDEAGKVVWSGDVSKPSITGIRLIRTVPNNLNTDFDLLITQQPFVERGRDICPFGNEYAIIGSTNQKLGDPNPAADTDILFKRISPAGVVLASTSFSLDNPDTPTNEDSQLDEGKSINPTIDGGLILLSSVGSLAIGGRGDLDYYLIKINAFGVKEWSSSFGSKFKDEAVAVRQTADQGYVVLGTTTQGALKILSLLKTDKNGKID